MRWKNSNNSQREDWLTFFQFDLVYFCTSDQFSRGVFSREKTLPWERSAVVWQMNRQSKDWQPFSILTHLQTAASQYFRVHSSPPCYQRPGVGECIMLSKEIREIQIVEDTTLTITSTTTSKPSLQSPLQSIVVVVVVFSVPWVWSGSPRSPHNMHTQVKKTQLYQRQFEFHAGRTVTTWCLWWGWASSSILCLYISLTGPLAYQPANPPLNYHLYFVPWCK